MIDKHNVRYYLPLYQALAEGKQIQERMIEPGGSVWRNVSGIRDSVHYDYIRIKPEPRECWVEFSSHCPAMPTGVSATPTIKWIKMREVLDE